MTSSRGSANWMHSQETIVAAFIILLAAGFSVMVPGFARADNLVGLLQSVTILGLLGIGMAVVVIARGIDLSMIAVMACPAAFVLHLSAIGWSVPTAVLLGLACAVATGLINGYLIAYARLPALFVTLATGLGLYGIATTMLNNDIIEWPSQMDSLSWIGRSTLAGLPVPMVIWIVLVCLVGTLLRRTRVGRFIYAIGDNPESANAIGIPVKRTIVFIYALSALIAYLAGITSAAVLHASAVRLFNSTFLYDVILVVVLGGIGLSGGRGSVLSVVLGTLMIGTVTNAMVLMDANYSLQNLVKGALLLAAIIADSRLNPRFEETAQQGDI
jgi:ribose transport system permease protein